MKSPRPGVRLIGFFFLVVTGFGATDPAEESYRLGIEAMQARRYETAVAELGTAVRLQPHQPTYQCTYAFALNSSGDADLARRAVQRCLQLDPQAPGAHLLAGVLDAAKGDYAQAVPHLEQALRQEPNNISVLVTLGRALSDASRTAEAIGYFRKATQLKAQFPDDYCSQGVAFLGLREPQNAESAFREALKFSPRDVNVRIQLGKSILAQARTGEPTRLGEAVNVYQEAVNLSPKNPELRSDLGYALARRGETQGAIAEYLEVLRLQPSRTLTHLTHVNLGLLYFAQGSWGAVQMHLGYAVAQDQNDFEAQYYLGAALQKTADNAGAEKHLLAAVQLRPDDPRVHFQLGSLYSGMGDASRSAAEYQRFRELTARQEEKARTDALERSAIVTLEKGNTEQAVASLRRLYEERPDTSSARNLALALLQTGKVAEARQLLEKALAMAPRDPATNDYLGLLEAHEGNLSGAKQYFETAASLDPSYKDALYNAGVAAARSGQTDVAIQHLQAALQLSDTPRVRKALALVYADAGRTKDSEFQFEAAQRLEARNGEKEYASRGSE